VRNGTLVVKFFLNISKKEQKKRFLERLDNPSKHWKFSEADLKERAFWDQYQAAFEDTITGTSTKHAPWWVVPSDNKWVSRAIVSAVLINQIRAIGLKRPEVSDEQRASLARARKQLLAEK
jgi:polyphosphate kinase 2 (PPK2 family)